MSEANGDELRGLRKRKIMEVTVANLSKPVRLRAWSTSERLRWESEVRAIGDEPNEMRGLKYMALAVGHSVVDDDGKQKYLLTDQDGASCVDPDAVADLAEMEFSTLNFLSKQVQELQGLDEEQGDEETDNAERVVPQLSAGREARHDPRRDVRADE